MRICAVSLPEVRVEIVRENDPSLERAPLGIVVAPPPMTETKLLGNTRLDVVSDRSTCPPWPAAATRAARWTSAPT